MTAAYEAAKNGASVLVIEKTAAIGGNIIVVGSALNGADPGCQRNQTMIEIELERIEELLTLELQKEIMKRRQDAVAVYIEAYKATGETCLYDSTSLHALQTYVDGDYVRDTSLVGTCAKGAADGVNYMESLGALWCDEVNAAIDATWKRSHMPTADNPWGSKGSEFVMP